jgi:hypothetical protein
MGGPACVLPCEQPHFNDDDDCRQVYAILALVQSIIHPKGVSTLEVGGAFRS